jgi:hypothetical protein
MPSKWSFSLKSPHPNLGCTFLFPHNRHMSRPNHLSIWSPKRYLVRRTDLKLSVMQSYPISCYLVQGQHFFLSTLFTNTHSLCSSLNVRNHISHVKKDKSIIIYKFWISCPNAACMLLVLYILVLWLYHFTVQQCMFCSPSLCDALHSHSSSLGPNVLKSSPFLSTT